MTNNEQHLRNKVACIEAYLRGEKVEINTVRDQWEVITEPEYIFDYGGHRYRIAPKPQPTIPKGVFWVRSLTGKDARLVIFIGGDGRFSVEGPHINMWTVQSANADLYWSHDRETWFTFTGEEVK